MTPTHPSMRPCVHASMRPVWATGHPWAATCGPPRTTKNPALRGWGTGRSRARRIGQSARMSSPSRRRSSASSSEAGSASRRALVSALMAASVSSDHVPRAASPGVRAWRSSRRAFFSATGTLQDPSSFRAQWRTAAAAIGFPWVTPHTFRKTVAARVADVEGLAAASAYLGHSHEAVTAGHYRARARDAADMRAPLAGFWEEGSSE